MRSLQEKKLRADMDSEWDVKRDISYRLQPRRSYESDINLECKRTTGFKFPERKPNDNHCK